MSNHISVIGAGTMGNGIAHVFAQKGFIVSLAGTNAAQLDNALQPSSGNLDRQITKNLLTEEGKKATLASITPYTDLGTGVQKAELVVEAATENTALKLKIFSQLDALAPAGCILASNTSSISITMIAAATTRPQSVIGLHFMNPVPVMKLIEIINGYATDASVTRQMVEIAGQLGKIPCVVKDYPGFIANRILMPMINEAIFSLFEGVAGGQEGHTAMKLGMAPPIGPPPLSHFFRLDPLHSHPQILHRRLCKPQNTPLPQHT